MQDFLYVLFMVGLMGLLVVLVVFCDKLIGASRTSVSDESDFSHDVALATPDEREVSV